MNNTMNQSWNSDGSLGASFGSEKNWKPQSKYFNNRASLGQDYDKEYTEATQRLNNSIVSIHNTTYDNEDNYEQNQLGEEDVQFENSEQISIDEGIGFMDSMIEKPNNRYTIEKANAIKQRYDVDQTFLDEPFYKILKRTLESVNGEGKFVRKQN
ncbi:serine tRS [Acrasis kona]|uniref:Serine tRS n=1 Tax=Acrasis kona TaxID=1008807 RepID=A0AAW2Z378_9EUKA